MIGLLPGGNVIATSLHLFVVPSARPVPVLLPERQSAGRPARSRLGPVLVFSIHLRRR